MASSCGFEDIVIDGSIVPKGAQVLVGLWSDES